MRKVAQLFIATIATLSFAGGAAFAATQTCSITGPTGPDSNNVCKNETENTITITCENKADILNINGQTSQSGTVTVDKNTGLGTVDSGNANNTNFVYNSAVMSCAPAQQASSTPSGGQGSSTPAPAASTPAAAALPSTGSNGAVVIAAIGTTIAAGVALASRFGASAYRKLF